MQKYSAFATAQFKTYISLTAYDGHTITYDSIGNPLSYYNGESYTMTWEQGRRLASVTTDGETITYNYDDDGIRTSKVLQGVEHRYLLNGTQIVAEIWGSNIVIYLYNENGSPIGMQFRYEGMAEVTFYTYFFEKNVFGDIVAVYGENGTRYVTYTYDASGNSL